MKTIFYLTILLTFLSCKEQTENSGDFKLSVSPSIDKTTAENKEIISVVAHFLQSKNDALHSNNYWLESDFERYVYPFADIYQIEKGQGGRNEYQPTLMELIDIAENSKLIKIGFVGYHAETKESLIRAIYNVIAIRNNNQWVLKRASDYETRNWNEKKVNSITYRFPKGKTINQHDIVRQEADITRLCNFFECSPIPITYYSCYDPKQVFEVKGFDYLPNMYYSQTGGMADYGNIIYSGNNSEYYTHEIVHIYAKKQFPKIESLLDEGMATYLGGSGIYDYNWHRAKFKTYLHTSSIDLAEHMQPYEQLYIDNLTPVPYMIGALICERTNRLYGKKELFKLLGSADELWVKLNRYGLTIDNLTEELKKELNYSYEWEFRATRKPITRPSYLERSTFKYE